MPAQNAYIKYIHKMPTQNTYVKYLHKIPTLNTCTKYLHNEFTIKNRSSGQNKYCTSMEISPKIDIIYIYNLYEDFCILMGVFEVMEL